MNDGIEIPISKIKAILLIVVCILMTAFGIYMLFGNIDSVKRYDPMTIRIFGGIFSVFFGGIGSVAFFRVIDKNSGLLINSRGITDNSSAISIGFIPWKDITGFKTVKVKSNKFLIIEVKNPEIYLAKGKNVIARYSLNQNYKTYNSPIAISAVILSMKFKELEELLNEAFDKYAS